MTPRIFLIILCVVVAIINGQLGDRVSAAVFIAAAIVITALGEDKNDPPA